MNPWRDVLRAIQRELERRSQEVEGRPVLPNRATVQLPSRRFGEQAPLLEAIAAELGQSLSEWADRGRMSWYGGIGPFLELQLVPEDALITVCSFERRPPLTRPGGAGV